MPYLDTQKEYISKTIKNKRTQKGLTQIDLAIKVGTTQTTIAKMERGVYGQWTYLLLCKVAQALDMIVDVKFMDVKADG